MTNQISLAALTILDAGPSGQIRAAAAAGWPSVGLRLMPLLDRDARVVGDPAAEAEVRRLLAETELAVLEIGVFPVKPTMDWVLVEAVAAFSAGLGARHLVCPVEDHDGERRLGTFRRLCDIAGRHGMDALVEFNPYSACQSLEDAVALARAAKRPEAGLVIDVLHLSRSGGSADDLAGVAPGLIRLVHLCDAPPPPDRSRSVEELRAESRTARLLPGEGSLALDRLLDVLPAGVPLSVEAPSARHAHLSAEERARRALEATRALLTRRMARQQDGTGL
jgi:sugar phosphate isomerase/epimerase